MALTLEKVDHIARLAHISLTDQEKARYRKQLSAILDYAKVLQELDTEAIPPTATILPIHNIMRPDETSPSMTQEEALSNAPVVEAGMFKVPVILE